MDGTVPNATGVSNPPNDPIIADNQPTDTAPDQTTQPLTNQAPDASQSSAQPNNGQGQDNSQQQSTDLSKTPKGPSTPASAAPTQPSPTQAAVNRASRLRMVTEALMGGPRYKENIDPTTGEMKRTQIPMSRGDIAMGLISEILSGALSGLSAPAGPNHAARAAEAGFQNGAQQIQQQQQQQDAQAQGDYARHLQVLETNLKMRQNAVALGKQNLETNQNYVAQYKPLVDDLMKNHPEAILGVVDEADLVKYHVTKDSVIPYDVVPRRDETGKQVEVNGEPQWDIQYAVVDPHFTGDNFLNDRDRATAVKYHLPGFVDGDGNATKLPQSLPMKLWMALNKKSTLSAIELAESDLGNYYKTLNGPSQATAPANLNQVKIPDASVSALADDAAQRYGVDPAWIRAIAMQESGGTPNKTSKAGAQGVMQLMPATQKQFGVTDPFNVAQNIEAGTKYFSQLLAKYKDPALALAAYNAGPGNVTDHIPQNDETPGYVSSILKAVGYGATQGGENENAYEPVDLVKAVQQDPTLPSALEKFQPLLDKRGGNYQLAVGDLYKTDPQAGGKIALLYGGDTAMQQYNTTKQLNHQQQQQQIKDQAQLTKESQSRRDKEQENEQAYLTDAKSIAGEQWDPGSGDMMALDHLISQRTADRPKVYEMAKSINPNFGPGNVEQKLSVWKGFADPQGKEYQQIKSANTLFDHIGGALEAANNFHNSSYGTAINKPLNEFRKQFEGDPNLATLISSLEPVKDEFFTFLNNQHALTESDKKSGTDILSWNMSPAVLEANLKKFADTAAYRLAETNKGWVSTFGSNVPNLISSDALQTLRALGPDSAAVKVLSGMDTGGSIVGASTGRGVPGKTVGEALGLKQPAIQNPQERQMTSYNGQWYMFHNNQWVNRSGGAQNLPSGWFNPPQGGTMRVQDKAGNWHWSDGKSDLGVIR